MRFLFVCDCPFLWPQLTLKKNKSQMKKQRLSALTDELNAMRAALGEKELLIVRSQTEVRELAAREHGARVLYFTTVMFH